MSVIKKLVHVFLSIGLSGCFLFQDDDILPVEEARIEMRAAAQEISSNFDRLANTPSIEALLFLKKILPVGTEWVLAMESAIESVSMYSIATINDQSKNSKNTTQILTSTQNLSSKKGVFQYNFNLDAFDLLNNRVDYLQYIFPGNTEHLINSRLNTALTINNLNIIVIADTVALCNKPGSYINRVNGQMYIDNQTSLTIDHAAGYNDIGMILSGETKMNAAPYQLSFSQKKAGNVYKALLSFKEIGITFLSYELDQIHANSGDAIEKAYGRFIITPLLFEGEIHPEDLCLCNTDDIVCLNEHINVAVKHTVLKKTIGRLEYRLYASPILQKEIPGLHIIYEDGSSELLSDLIQARFAR